MSTLWKLLYPEKHQGCCTWQGCQTCNKENSSAWCHQDWWNQTGVGKQTIAHIWPFSSFHLLLVLCQNSLFCFRRNENKINGGLFLQNLSTWRFRRPEVQLCLKKITKLTAMQFFLTNGAYSWNGFNKQGAFIIFIKGVFFHPKHYCLLKNKILETIKFFSSLL